MTFQKDRLELTSLSQCIIFVMINITSTLTADIIIIMIFDPHLKEQQ